jgi:hypothetical protein
MPNDGPLPESLDSPKGVMLKLQERLKHPDFWELNATDVFNGFGDAARDNIPADDIWRERITKRANALDRILLPFPPLGAILSQIINRDMEKDKEKKKQSEIIPHYIQ